MIMSNRSIPFMYSMYTYGSLGENYWVYWLFSRQNDLFTAKMFLWDYFLGLKLNAVTEYRETRIWTVVIFER